MSTYPGLSASERWGRHYFACDICQADEFDPAKDRFCWLGAMLRDASINASKVPPMVIMKNGLEVCLVCQEPLLPYPVFWIDRHKDGIHEVCEEQRLAEEELDNALRREAGF
jgi:hypothetical protein